MPTIEEMRQCFRPLPGDLISQFVRELNTALTEMRVSVPFPGILFLNWKVGDCIIEPNERVSVPFPGILFLNPVLYMPDLNWIPKPNCGAKPNPTLE